MRDVLIVFGAFLVMVALCFFWALLVVPMFVSAGTAGSIILSGLGGFFIGWAVAKVAFELLDW